MIAIPRVIVYLTVINIVFLSRILVDGVCVAPQTGAPYNCSCDDQVHPSLLPVRDVLRVLGIGNISTCLASLSNPVGLLSRVNCVGLLGQRLTTSLMPLSAELCSANKTSFCRSSTNRSLSAECAVCRNAASLIAEIGRQLAVDICKSISNGKTDLDQQRMVAVLRASLLKVINGTVLDSILVAHSALIDNALLAVLADFNIVQTAVGMPELLYGMSSTLASFHLPKRDRFYPQNMFLLCTSLYPVCRLTEANFSTSRNHSLGRSGVVHPCPWLCTGASMLLYLAEKFSPANSSQLQSTVTYTLLQTLVHCESEPSKPSSSPTWNQCSDVLCNSGAGRYICEYGSSDYYRAKSESNQVCLDQKCLFPLQMTPDPKHWSTEGQSALRNLFGIVQNFFSVPMQFNGSLLPCGAACTGIIFNMKVESRMRTLVVITAFITIIVEILAIFSFFLNRNKLNRFPSRLLIYVSACYMIACCAFLVQVSTGWDHIVCNPDGTLRDHLPGEDSHGARGCVMIFIILYFSLISSLMWWFCLTHAWFSTFRSIGKARNPAFMERGLSRQELIYHGIVWPLAVVLCAVAVQTGQIDGVAMYGVCFTTNETLWFLLMTLPVIVLGICGGPFLIKGIAYLTHHRHSLSSMKVHRRGSQAESSIVGLQRYQAKLGILVVASFLHLLVQCALGLYQRVEWNGWLDQIKAHVICHIATCTDQQHLCPALPQPSPAAFGLLAIAVFLEGIVLCSWMATRENVAVWRMFLSNPIAILQNGAYYGLRRSTSFRGKSMRQSSKIQLTHHTAANCKQSTVSLTNSSGGTDKNKTVIMSTSSLSSRSVGETDQESHQILPKENSNIKSKQKKEKKKKKKKKASFSVPDSPQSENLDKLELSEYVTGADKVFTDEDDDFLGLGRKYGLYVTGADKARAFDWL